MPNSPHDFTRRGFLQSAGIASALAAWPAVGRAAQEPPPADAKATLDELLAKDRARVAAADGRIGGTLAHVPLALMAMYRVGASAQQMRSFFGDDPRPARPPAPAAKEAEGLTPENWKSRLRTGVTYSRWLGFFDGWTTKSPVAEVLEQTLPALIQTGISAFDHNLILMAYAVDHGGREQIVHALATWAEACGVEREFDAAPAAVEPDALLAELVEATSDLKLEPRGGNSGPINWRLDQVYRHAKFSRALKPVRVLESDPLRKYSEIILGLFGETHEFTLLHALTTCQALRQLLPYVRAPERTLSSYWHSVCASYLSVRRMPQWEVCKQPQPSGGAGWDAIPPKALASDRSIQESQYVHRVKLVYSCRREFDHYKLDQYRAVAAREAEHASQIILG